MDGLSSERKPPESKWRTIFRRSRLEQVQVVKNNTYDQGLLHNIHEVIFPFSSRPSFSRRKPKSGWNCCKLKCSVMWWTVFNVTIDGSVQSCLFFRFEGRSLSWITHEGGWPFGDCTIYPLAFCILHSFLW